MADSGDLGCLMELWSLARAARIGRIIQTYDFTDGGALSDGHRPLLSVLDECIDTDASEPVEVTSALSGDLKSALSGIMVGDPGICHKAVHGDIATVIIDTPADMPIVRFISLSRRVFSKRCAFLVDGSSGRPLPNVYTLARPGGSKRQATIARFFSASEVARLGLTADILKREPISPSWELKDDASPAAIARIAAIGVPRKLRQIIIRFARDVLDEVHPEWRAPSNRMFCHLFLSDVTPHSFHVDLDVVAVDSDILAGRIGAEP